MMNTGPDDVPIKLVGIARMLNLIERYIWNSRKGQLLLLAVLFTAAYYTNHVSTKMVEPDSKAAEELLSSSTITKIPKGYRLVYRARNIRINTNDSLLPLIESFSFSTTYFHSELGEIWIDVPDEAVLINIKEQLTKADIPDPESRIIQGRLSNVQGKAIANARVDLMGDYCMINYCRTRADGTFLLVTLDDLPKRRVTCYLRFQTSNPKHVFNSASFTLDKAKPVICVQASRNVIEKYKLLWVLTAILALLFTTHDLKQWLRQWRHRPGTCLNCGYDVRGTVSHRCSECGTIIAEQVRVELERLP